MSDLMWNWPRFPSEQQRDKYICGSEVEALEKIAEKGGRSDYRVLGPDMGFGSHYMSVILRTLGNADYIDFAASGMCTLTHKGRNFLVKKGLLSQEKAKEIEMRETFKKDPWIADAIKREEELKKKQQEEEEMRKEGKSNYRRPQIKHAEELFAARSAEELFAQKTEMDKRITGVASQNEKPKISPAAVGLDDVEFKVLKGLAEVGGHIAGRNLASKMGYGYNSLRVDQAYRRLGAADYLDYRQSGIVHLLPKGRELLGRLGYQA